MLKLCWSINNVNVGYAVGSGAEALDVGGSTRVYEINLNISAAGDSARMQAPAITPS